MSEVKDKRLIAIKPYLFHGLDLEEGDRQAIGDCPVCGKEGKFHVGLEDGKGKSFAGGWDCKSCGESGNPLEFIRWLHGASKCMGPDAVKLAGDRGLISAGTLDRWGCVVSIITGDWLVPGYNAEGKLVQLYKLARMPGGKRRLLATPTLNHGIHGVGLWDPRKPEVYVCEGPWDGMVLWEVMGAAKRGEDGRLRLTAAEGTSLLSRVNVLAVPGANTFPDGWARLCAGKRVILLYDSDHPRQVEGPDGKEGRTVEGAGVAGMRRTAEVLARAAEPPESIHYLKWGEHGYDPDSPSGYDVRDLLREDADKLSERLPNLDKLLGLIGPIPEDWVRGRTKAAARSGGTEVELLPCRSYKDLVTAWRKAVKWIYQWDHTLACMLACAVSTDAGGQDQLWVKVIGPPSCGKSTLSEALSVNRKHVKPTDTFTGLISGYQLDREGSENMSLAGKLAGKTLIINDGDTLLALPNLPQILSQLRTFYGRNIRAQYGNKMSHDHEGINTTIIVCGTAALYRLDSSELGERFLNVTMVEEIDEDLEEEIALRKVYQTARDMTSLSNGTPESRDSPEMLRAKQLTGGYLGYLRENAQSLIARVEDDDTAFRQCVRYGKLVSFMRARPSSSRQQEERQERELSYRLSSQLVRLAKCLAVVLGKRQLDAEVMGRVRAVALDTARGRTLEITHRLYEVGEEGAEAKSIVIWTGEPDEKVRKLLRFLKTIKALDSYQPTNEKGHKSGSIRWRLTTSLRKLYQEVFRTNAEAEAPGY